MIFYYFVLFFTSVLNLAFAWVPTVTELPFGIDGFFLDAIGYVESFIHIFWPLQPVWNVLLIYIPIKLSLLVLKVILGSRVPHADL